MNKFTFALAAAGLMSVAACSGQSPEAAAVENAAENSADLIENQADLLEDAADNATTEGAEAALENQADALQNTADAVQAAGAAQANAINNATGN